MDIPTLLIFGLLWGALFGMLGASLKVAQGQWRHMIHFYLHTNRRSQVVGMITGGLAAAGLGLALSLLVLYCIVAYTSYSSFLMANTLCASADWQVLTMWSIVQGPLHAVNVFAFSFGAPITIVNQAVSGQSCFYAYAPHTTLSLLDAASTLHQPWLYALGLIPAISLFLGGRVSVATARVRGTGPAAVQGTLIAIPFAVLMTVLIDAVQGETVAPAARAASIAARRRLASARAADCQSAPLLAYRIVRLALTIAPPPWASIPACTARSRSPACAWSAPQQRWPGASTSS